MTVLAILTSTFLAALPTPSEIRSDLEANPYRPAPAAPPMDSAAKKPKDTTPIATAKPVQNAAPAPSAPATAAAPAASSSGPWTIQLGAISNSDAARTEQKRLEKIVGGTVDIVVEPPMHKLRWGAFATKEEAESAKAALKAKSVDGYVVHR